MDAILVGVGTVLADDPMLTARVKGGRNPIRVVLDSKLRTPATSQLVQSAQQVRTIIACTKGASAKKRAMLEKKGVVLLEIRKTRDGRVDLKRLLEALYRQEINSVLVEGGGTTHGAFVDQKLVNKVVLFMAPMLIGGDGAPTAVKGKGAGRLTEALSLEDVKIDRVGPDLMVVGYARHK